MRNASELLMRSAEEGGSAFIEKAVRVGLARARYTADIHVIQASFQTSASGAQAEPAVLDCSSGTKPSTNN